MKFFTSILVFCLLVSCKDQLKLENQQAQDLIVKSLGLPKSHTISLENSSDYTAAFDLLQQNDLLNWKWKWEGSGYWEQGNHSFDFDVNLTEKGKPFLLGKTQKKYSLMTYDVYEFKAYDIDFANIEGISINQEQKTATVRFTTYATNISPIAESLAKGGLKKYIPDHIDGQTIFEVVFKKFDTGWQQTSDGIKKIGENDTKVIGKMSTH